MKKKERKIEIKSLSSIKKKQKSIKFDKIRRFQGGRTLINAHQFRIITQNFNFLFVGFYDGIVICQHWHDGKRQFFFRLLNYH